MKTNAKVIKRGEITHTPTSARRFSFSRKDLCIPYGLFLLLFVIVPLFLVVYYAFTDANGVFSIANFSAFFADKTKHASERATGRSIIDSQIDDAIKNPLFKGDVVIDEQGRKSVKYIGLDATVILNPDTEEVVTTWKTGSRIKKKYGKGD